MKALLEERHGLANVIIRSRIDLPEGFHNVAIGKKEIEQLARFGVEYEREQVRFSR